MYDLHLVGIYAHGSGRNFLSRGSRSLFSFSVDEKRKPFVPRTLKLRIGPCKGPGSVTLKSGSLSISMAWFFQSSTESANHCVVVIGSIDNNNQVGASDLPAETGCDFPPLFLLCSRVMIAYAPSPLPRPAPSVGLAGLRDRAALLRRLGRPPCALADAAQRRHHLPRPCSSAYAASGAVNRSLRLSIWSRVTTGRRVTGLLRVGRLSSCRRMRSNSYCPKRETQKLRSKRSVNRVRF